MHGQVFRLKNTPVDLPAQALCIHLYCSHITQSEGEDEEVDEETPGDESVPAEEEVKKQRMDKKRKLKERFDMEYDDGDAEATYFDDLKGEMQKQAEVRRILNKSLFYIRNFSFLV